ncbi:MAG: helix-hairpin-helix domain-containing protein [Erysipelotrichaceae bacterium]
MKKLFLFLLVCFIASGITSFRFLNVNELKNRPISVEVKGNVKAPKIYKCPINTTVGEIIELAGGLLPKADTRSLNLGSTVYDKDVIVVPLLSDSSSSCISINSASIEELDGLNGIGPSAAQKIIDYRTNVNSFKTIEEIMQIKGIKEKLFAKIKDQICL